MPRTLPTRGGGEPGHGRHPPLIDTALLVRPARASPAGEMNLLRIGAAIGDRGVMSSDLSHASEGASAVVTRDAAAIIISVGEEMTEVLGSRPEDLLGRPSPEFPHPGGQPRAIVARFEW